MKLILLISTVFFYSSLANAFSEVEIVFSPADAPVIFSGITLNYPEPNENYEVYINGPWAKLNLYPLNKTRETLVIVSVTATAKNELSTEPVTAELFSGPYKQQILGTIKPYFDTNCDGYVSDDELINSLPGNCQPDIYEFYVYSMLGNLTGPELDLYRESKFTVSMRFEGWFEFNGDPTKNFFKRIEFDLNAR